MATHLDIVNGPGRWDIILSLFEGKEVHFEFKGPGEAMNGFPFVISSVTFLGPKRELCSFRTDILHSPGSRTLLFTTDGVFNLRTRKGRINTDLSPGSQVHWKEGEFN